MSTSPAAVPSTWKYDAFGRVTTFPTPDGAGTVANTFYVNDLIAAQTTGTTSASWTLDPLQRRTTYTRKDGTAAAVTKTSYYGDDTDNPAWIKEGSAADAPVTRYLIGATGEAVMSTTRTGGRTLLLTDLHGDVVTTVPLTEGTAASINTAGVRHHSYDEFGNARALGGPAASPGRYGWLGAHERSTEALGGVVLMGVRLYSAAIGRFLTIDPVPGGNATAYNYPQGPINSLDLDGKAKKKKKGGFGAWWGKWGDTVMAGVGIVGLFACGAVCAVAAGISIAYSAGKTAYHLNKGEYKAAALEATGFVGLGWARGGRAVVAVVNLNRTAVIITTIAVSGRGIDWRPYWAEKAKSPGGAWIPMRGYLLLGSIALTFLSGLAVAPALAFAIPSGHFEVGPSLSRSPPHSAPPFVEAWSLHWLEVRRLDDADHAMRNLNEGWIS